MAVRSALAFAEGLVTDSNRQDPVLLVRLAEALDANGRYEESKAVEEEAVALCAAAKASATAVVRLPLADFRIQLASALLTRLDKAGMESLWRSHFTLVEPDPDLAIAFYRSARSLFERQRTRDAALTLSLLLAQHAVQRDGRKTVEYLRLYADILLVKGKVQEAVATQEEAIEKCADNPRMRQRLEAWLALLRKAGFAASQPADGATKSDPSAEGAAAPPASRPTGKD